MFKSSKLTIFHAYFFLTAKDARVLAERQAEKKDPAADRTLARILRQIHKAAKTGAMVLEDVGFEPSWVRNKTRKKKCREFVHKSLTALDYTVSYSSNEDYKYPTYQIGWK